MIANKRPIDVSIRIVADNATSLIPSHQPPPNGGRLDGVVGIPNQEKA